METSVAGRPAASKPAAAATEGAGSPGSQRLAWHGRAGNSSSILWTGARTQPGGEVGTGQERGEAGSWLSLTQT